MEDDVTRTKILKKVEEFSDQPFILKDLETLNASSKILRAILEDLVKENVLGKRKLGRMSVYWLKKSEKMAEKAESREFSPRTTKIEISSEKKRIKDLELIVATKNKQIEQLELELKELQSEVMELRAKVRELQLAEGIDDPWKEVAMRMAEVLAEMRGLTMKEVLRHFGVRDEML